MTHGRLSRLYSPDEFTRAWKPGRVKRFPWTGVLSLIGSILGIAVCVGILVGSNSKVVEEWKYQPTVYLSIAYTITNLLVALAFREGVTVNWWRRALREDTTLGDLHRNYEFGENLWAALGSGRKVNRIAIAAVVCALVPINGPLLQRASTVARRTAFKPAFLSLPAAVEQQSPTGYVTGRNYQVSFLSPGFQPIAQAFTEGQPIAANASGCGGSSICRGKLRALGWNIQCNTSTPSFELVPSDEEMLPGAVVFDTSLDWMLQRNPNEITLKAVSKQDPACSGTLVQHDCSLKPATVRYPIEIDGNKSTIVLAPGSDYRSDEIVNATVGEVREDVMQGQKNLAGFYMALQDRLGASMQLNFSGAVGYTVISDGGSFPGRFANYSAVEDPAYPGVLSASNMCNVTFRDPLDYMLSEARELMFRKALADGNSSMLQPIIASEEITASVFHSHYLFLGLAIFLTLTAVAVVSATYYGFWEVGRPVTMNPIEVAKAFDAPMLVDCQSNAKVNDLARDVDRVPVRYGAVSRNRSRRGSLSEESEYSKSKSNLDLGVELTSPQRLVRLAITHKDDVRPPHEGQRFR